MLSQLPAFHEQRKGEGWVCVPVYVYVCELDLDMWACVGA